MLTSSMSLGAGGGAGAGAGDSLDNLRVTMQRNQGVPAAGKVWNKLEEGTAYCLQFPDKSDANVKGAKWRHSTEPGVRVLHPGLRDVPVDDSKIYGVSTQTSAHVEDVIQQEPKTVLEQMLRAHGEKELRSVKDEPLGKAKVHSGALPAHVTGKDYRFGVKSSKTEAAKSLLYPATDPDAESKAPKRTARYRGVQKPGEQRTRGYNWDNTTVANPTTHRFGMTDPYALRDGEGAALALRPDIDTAIPKRSVVPKRVADFQQVSKDHLGRAKNLGRGAPRNMPEVFGVTSSGDAWSAADCIRGDYTLEQQLPDADLGKSVSKGYRNLTTDPERTFGIPTIRKDIPAKSKNSVADHQNYGQDADAASLLHPARFVGIGVDHRDFAEQKSPAEVRALFEKIGYSLDDGEFASVWHRAATAYDLSGDGQVSIEEFRLALNEYDDAAAEGKTPAWFKK